MNSSEGHDIILALYDSYGSEWQLPTKEEMINHSGWKVQSTFAFINEFPSVLKQIFFEYIAELLDDQYQHNNHRIMIK